CSGQRAAERPARRAPRQLLRHPGALAVSPLRLLDAVRVAAPTCPLAAAAHVLSANFGKPCAAEKPETAGTAQAIARVHAACAWTSHTFAHICSHKKTGPRPPVYCKLRKYRRFSRR